MASFLKRSKQKEELPETATGVKQTIQARHGTATFVPKGFTIKIINTYGRQVVDTWAFALHAPPTQEEWNEDNKDANDIEEEDEQIEEAAEKEIEEDTSKLSKSEVGDPNKIKSPEDSQTVVVEHEPESPEEEKNNADSQQEEVKNKSQETDKSESKANVKKEGEDEDEVEEEEEEEEKRKEEETTEDADARQDDAGKSNEREQSAEGKATDSEKPEEMPSEQAASEKQGKTWSSYLPSIRGRGKQASTVETKAEEPEPKKEEKGSPTASKSWTAYIPSVRRGKQNPNDEPKSKEQRTWSSYIPSGQGFSSYIRNNDAISSFASLHQRDPTKSVAEQLYEFSKTPVGAAGISVASGSGYASSLYAAYTAYSSAAAKRADQNHPGMEFLSMAHTRVSTRHLSPEVGDVLVTNLRAPLLTLIEDRSPGGHDTLMAACDPIRYRELGVKNWAEHGSCAENLVLALQELNKQTGLKGGKAIGGEVTVNSAPTPLNLFMNVQKSEEGELSFSSPRGQRGDFVRFRAERDVVLVMSACPQDATNINGGKPMVAHFVVESPSEEDRKIADQRAREAQAIIEKARRRTEAERQRRTQPFRHSSSNSVGRPRSIRQQSGQRAPPKKLERRASSRSESTVSVPRKESQRIESPPPRPRPSATPARNKPRKLERRTSTPRPPQRG